MNTVFLEALDVLYLRGNQHFGSPGAHGAALMPPWPSLAAGALRSVSYTHLDVYKRQVRGWVLANARAMLAEILQTTGTPDDPGLPCHAQLEQQLAGFPEVHWAAVLDPALERLRSVSYTHLDVYKRQRRRSAGRRTGRRSPWRRCASGCRPAGSRGGRWARDSRGRRTTRAGPA